MSITAQQAELVRRTAKAAFFKELRQPTGQMAWCWPMVTTEMPSDSDQETYPWLGQVPQLREWTALRDVKSLPGQTFTIRNRKWEGTIAVENDLVRRDKLGIVAIRARDLARRAMSHRESLLIDTLLLGEATNCYDGQYFFDDDHADPGAVFTSSQDNDLTSAAATGTIPTPAEFEAAVNAMLNGATGLDGLRVFTDDQGEPWNFAEDLHWIIPPAYELAARTVLGTGTNISPADSTGITGAFRGLGTVHVSNYLPARQTALGQTADNRFYLLNAAPVVRPIIFQLEREPEFETLGPGSDHSFKTDTTLYGVNASYNMGYGPWQHAVVHTFS